MSRRLLACAMVSGALLATAAPAVADTAPGRVLLPNDIGVVNTDDLGGQGLGLALPDGGALVVAPSALATQGFALARINAAGALDTSFGTSGLRAVTASFQPIQMIRQPDGKVLIAGTSFANNNQLSIVRLNADGTPDPTFGSGGTASPAITGGCGGPPCAIAALAPDGAIFMTGMTGVFPNTINGVGTERWAVAKLTAAGAPDATFGQAGIAQLSTLPSSGFSVVAQSDGTILASGQAIGPGPGMLLTRLTAAGTPDPTFAGGTPISLPFASSFPPPLVQADGSIVVAGQTTGSAVPGGTPGHQIVARYTAAGAPDATFGTAGAMDYGTALQIQQLLPAPGGRVLVNVRKTARLVPNFQTTPKGTLQFALLADNGSLDTAFGTAGGLSVTLPFGGGESQFLVSVHPRPQPSLRQNDFGGTALIARPDGSYLVVGGVAVVQPTGEGDGRSTMRLGVAALTPALALDPAFGGPPTALRASVSVAVQRAATARTRHGIRVRIKMSAPGLMRVSIKSGSRTIATNVLPIQLAGNVTLPVELTHTGNAYLLHHRNVRVTVTASARDLLANGAHATATGRLR